MIEPEVQLAKYIRDLLNVSESIISIGRLNKYDNEKSSQIVIDNLSPATQQSVTKTYDGDTEKTTIDSLMLGQFTINFYGANSYSSATLFMALNPVEEARTLQKTYGVTVLRTTQITNLKRLAGKVYDSRYEITLNVSYNITTIIDRLRFDTAQFGEILVNN